MRWTPHVTVAAIAQQDNRFLFVEERIDGRLVLNQPAGHLDDGEDLMAAVVRETLEETAWHFRPEALTGLYRWRHPGSSETFLRVTFSGRCQEHHPEQPLDEGIERTLWLTWEELLTREDALRSPLVLRSLDDHLAGRRYPLSLLRDIA